MKTPILLAMCVGTAIAIAGCTYSVPATEQSTVTVGVSFYILQEITEQVGGERVTVVSPPGSSGGHNYSPSPQDVATLLSSDMFIYQGASFDTWAEKIVPDFQDQGKPTLAVTDYLKLRAVTDTHESETEDQAEEDHSAYDPHTWTDPVLVMDTVNVVRDALIELDPEHADEYTTNAAHYIVQLEELDAAYVNTLASCSQNTIIVAHDAFGYMADRYGFQIESIAGFSPDLVPSAKHLAELNSIISEHEIRYILFETLATPDVAESLASDIGAKTLVLNPVEGLTATEQQANASYISLMEDNLVTLKTALDCQ